MREIIFRAKARFDGRWVEGYLTGKGSISECMETVLGEMVLNPIQVDPETVSQYTGLKDREGDMIFEGDVLSVLVENPFTKPNLLKGEVEITKYGVAFGLGYVYDHENRVKIIGNRWDNPELLQ